MRTRKPALALYFTACIVAIIAVFIDNDSLLLISKPTIIPAILFYYLSARTTKTNPLVILFLLLNFISDTIVLLEIKESTLMIMGPYFLSYLILIWFAIQDCRRSPFDRFSAVVGAGIFLIVITLSFMLTRSFSAEQQYLIVPGIVYGLSLATYSGLAGYYFFTTVSNLGLLLVISALFCIVSDVFYVLFSLILVFPGFYAFNLGVQLLSYYFLVRYFILRKH